MGRAPMPRRLLASALMGALALAGCASRSEPLESSVRTVTTKVAVPVPCRALMDLGEDPSYPDTPEAIAQAETIGALAALYAKGRALRVQRLAEYAAAKEGCLF